MREIKDLHVDVDIYREAIYLNWIANTGFGTVSISDMSGTWKADTECMCKGEDKEFIRKLLNAWVDEIEVIG